MARTLDIEGKITTGDLYRRLANTERSRSARAESVFRRLRQELVAPQENGYISQLPVISQQMKRAARNAD